MRFISPQRYKNIEFWRNKTAFFCKNSDFGEGGLGFLPEVEFVGGSNFLGCFYGEMLSFGGFVDGEQVHAYFGEGERDGAGCWSNDPYLVAEVEFSGFHNELSDR